MKMKVILVENIPHQGKAGEIVEVKRGYAMNYLIPRGLALFTTTSNVKKLEHDRNIILQKVAAEMKEISQIAEKINLLKPVFVKKTSSEGRLFGSVTVGDIKEYLDSENFKMVEKKWIKLPEHLKEVGEYEVKIYFPQEVEAVLHLEIKGEKNELESNEETTEGETD